MHQPHRARELHLGRLDQDHLALDAAKLALLVAGTDAAAIDHDAVEIICRDVAGELDGAAGGADALVQLRQHAARLDMALGREEQRIAKAAFQRRLERSEAGGVEPAVVLGHARRITGASPSTPGG